MPDNSSSTVGFKQMRPKLYVKFVKKLLFMDANPW